MKNNQHKAKNHQNPIGVHLARFTLPQKWGAAILVIVLVLLVWNLIPAGDIYVSDLEYEILNYEWSEPKKDQSIDGNSLLIDDKWYQKGIGTHANANISVEVPEGYTHFIAEVGIDDEIAEDKPGSVQFRVVGDGVILWETPVLMPTMAPFRIYVNVEGIEILNLVADNSGDSSNSDHADWGAARFAHKK